MSLSLQSRPVNPIITLASLTIIVSGMKFAAPLLNPFFLSVFIAIVCWPVLTWLKQKGMPSGLSISLVVLVLIIVLLGLGAYIATAAHQFSREVVNYQASLQNHISIGINWLHKYNIALPNERDLLNELNASKIMHFFGSILSGLGNLFANVFLILLTVIFLLLEFYALPHKISVAFGDSNVNNHSFQIVASIKRYLVIKIITSLVTGIAITLWLSVLHVEFAVLWGVIAFMLNFVPNIGSIIAAVPTVLLALVQQGIDTSLLVAAGYLVVNTVIGNIWEPKIMGKGLGLSTLVVFLSLAFWGWIFGSVGMILSVPFTMIAKIIMENEEKTRWIAVLLGPGNMLAEQAEKTRQVQDSRDIAE